MKFENYLRKGYNVEDMIFFYKYRYLIFYKKNIFNVIFEPLKFEYFFLNAMISMISIQ